MAEETTWGGIFSPDHAFWAAVGAAVIMYGPRFLRDGARSAGEQMEYGKQAAAERAVTQRVLQKYREAGEFAGPGAEGLYSVFAKVSKQLEALTQYMQSKEAQ